MTETVRIGFVGVGSMGQCAHLQHYVAIPGCRVVALSELRPKLTQAVARRYAVPNVYPDAQLMLAHEKLDGLVAAQPFEKHSQIIPPLYAAGIPILTEKPLASSVASGERMLATLQEGGSWHMVGYHKRSDPATMYARREIERLKASGELGPLKYVRLTMPSGDWIAGGFNALITSDEPYPATPGDPEAAESADYIAFVNYYIHQVNLMRHLLGEPYQVTYAEPSGVLLVGQSASGIPCALEMTPYQTTLDWQESALVAFERGYVKLELPAPLASARPGRVELFRDPGSGAIPETRTPQMPWVSAMRQQALNFVAAIRGEMAPPCEAAEALEDLKIARDYVNLWKGKAS